MRNLLLYALVIFLFLVLIVPFALMMAGINIVDFRAVSGKKNLGILLRSTDNGSTWSGSGITENPKIPFPSRLYTLAFHPADPTLAYAGGKSSGLWVSATQGASWRQAEDAARVLSARADVYKIGVAPSDPLVMYIAVFQNGYGRVLRTDSGGAAFQEIYAISTRNAVVYDLWIDPRNPAHVIIGTGEGGIIETLDGGRFWRAMHWFGEAVTQIEVDSLDPQKIYTELSGRTLWKTEDAGKTWANITPVLQNGAEENSSEGTSGTAPIYVPGPLDALSYTFGLGTAEISRVVISSVSFDHIFIGAANGIFKSEDAGKTWRRLNTVVPSRAFPIQAVALYPNVPQVLFTAIANRLYRTDNGGEQWLEIRLPVSRPISMIYVHPLSPQVLFAILAK